MDIIQDQISHLSLGVSYAPSPYQMSALANVDELNIIPDWYNLFVVSLLHSHEKIKEEETVTFYSTWSEAEILRVIRESPLFTEFYLAEIKDKILFKKLDYSLLTDPVPDKNYTIMIGRRASVGRRRGQPELKSADCCFDLVRDIGDYAKVDSSYHKEQLHPVWVRNKTASYPVNTTPFRVGTCLSSDDV